MCLTKCEQTHFAICERDLTREVVRKRERSFVHPNKSAMRKNHKLGFAPFPTTFVILDGEFEFLLKQHPKDAPEAFIPRKFE